MRDPTSDRCPGVLDGCPRRLDTAAAGAIIGAPRGESQSGSANPRRVLGLGSENGFMVSPDLANASYPL